MEKAPAPLIISEGAQGFATHEFDGLVQVVQVLNQYWIEIVALPAADD